MGFAPAIESKRSAVVAQKIGIQRLEQSERFEASGEAVLPRGRPAPISGGGARKKDKCERRERLAGAKIHIPVPVAIDVIRLEMGLHFMLLSAALEVVEPGCGVGLYAMPR
jgi:hypothetical protein